ncbi:THAP domain-containing protein 6 [Larimichthys crocea]|uniref:THAP domain-containing protein 6 n=1 Tax=Larimichthys crocea TaxID=215358 RepID=A0A6G0HPY0_LARCR|nr:THAP domain-containing protein 6 [Larimichthys crocea]
MPDFCAAYGCANHRCLETRKRGITFHRFPKDGEGRRRWEVAIRRDGFAASARTLLCSEHFRSEDFDRTGQIVRLRDGVVPTIFNLPAHLQRSETRRSTSTSRRAEDNLPNSMDLIPDGSAEERSRLKEQRKQQATEHSYALPGSPEALKAKLEAALARVRKLEREKSNAFRREKRAKNNMQALLEELKEKNLINEELKDKLERYSGCRIHQGPERFCPYAPSAWSKGLSLPERHSAYSPATSQFIAKVSLAAQTLSNSVAVALRTLQDLDYAEFRDSEATSEFIKMPVSKWCLSVLGFVVNIDTLMSMVPVLLEGQRYILTYRFSQDHLELLFNSIRASGGWNNNPNASQFKYIFRKLMARCGVVSRSGNVTAQDDTESLTATIDTSTSLSAVDMSSAAGGDLPSPFADIPALVHDHSYLPIRFSGLVDNALVYISGFVVRRALKQLACDVCRASLVTDAASAIKDQSYHLLTLRNNGGLVIPSEGTVRVVREAESAIRQASANCRRSQPIKLKEVEYIVRKRIGSEDVFVLGEHISDTQYGIDSHNHTLLTLVVSLFLK